MNDRKYLKLKSRTSNKLYKIRLGEFNFIRPDESSYDAQYLKLKVKGENFYSFMLNYAGETFDIVGTKSSIYIDYFTLWEGTPSEVTYLGAKLTAVNKKGETITYDRFIFNTEREYGLLYSINALSIARCFLAIDTDSNSLFPLHFETHYTTENIDGKEIYTPFFTIPAPYTIGIERDMDLPSIDGKKTRRRNISSVLQGSARAFRELTSKFPGYEELATGEYISSLDHAGSVVYCALRNFSDPDPDNPEESPIDIIYEFPGEPSGPSGGGGEMEDTNEETELKPPNILNVKYFTRVYKLTPAQVEQLRGYLWSDDFITNLPKLFSDPFSALIGIQAVPLDITGNEVDVHIGTLNTGVNGVHVRDYYNTIDLGAIDITEYWQSFLDYQPYTRLKLFLPYIGIVDLPTDQFMNQSIGIKYRIDVLSGACIAVISNSTNIICQFTGNCATKMPISASDHSSIISNSLVGLTAVAGNVATGNVAGTVASSANVMLGLKEKIQISGSLSTNHGILVNDTPYLMIERPTSDIPAGYGALKGFTSNISLKLSACSGFTKVSDIKLDGISATDEEKTELLALLQTGVYL